MVRKSTELTNREIAKRLTRTWARMEDRLPEGTGLCIDLGCGDGRHKDAITSKGYHWLGVDKENRGGVKVLADAHHLPFRDESVSLVLMWQSLQEMRRPWEVVRETHRILQPGGWLYGSTSYLEPNYDSIRVAFSDLGLRDLLSDAGFVNIELHPGILLLPVLFRTLGMRMLGLSPKDQKLFSFGRTLVRSVIRIYLYFYDLLKGKCHASSAKTWLGEQAHFDLAAQIIFLGRKK